MAALGQHAHTLSILCNWVCLAQGVERAHSLQLSSPLKELGTGWFCPAVSDPTTSHLPAAPLPPWGYFSRSLGLNLGQEPEGTHTLPGVPHPLIESPFTTPHHLPWTLYPWLPSQALDAFAWSRSGY